MPVLRRCQRKGCHNFFLTYPSRIKIGGGRFCSMDCGYQDRKDRVDLNPTCRICGDPLTDDNWWAGSKETRDFRCKSCQNKRYKKWATENKEKKLAYGKKYREENRDQRLKYKAEYRKNNQHKIKEYEKTVIGTTRNGKRIKIRARKRDITPYCEICGRDDMKLHYHHRASDEDYYVPLGHMPGIWVDLHCHGLCHSIEDSCVDCECEAYNNAWANAYEEVNALIKKNKTLD